MTDPSKTKLQERKLRNKELRQQINLKMVT